MFYHIIYILFKLKLIQLSEKSIIYWTQQHQVEKLEYALKHGNYKTRIRAAEALEIIGQPSSIPVLISAINDKVQNVSIAVLNALDRIKSTPELNTIIIKKRFNWVQKNRENTEKINANKNKKYSIYRWERTSKKSFERVKEQLKRPMR